MTGVLHTIGNVGLCITLISSIAFCVTYAIVAPWRLSKEGWHLMTFTIVIAWTFAYFMWRQIITTTPPANLEIEIPRMIGALTWAGLVTWRLLLLIRAQIWRDNDD